MSSHLEWCSELVQRRGDLLARHIAEGKSEYVIVADECALLLAVAQFRRALEG